jgi:hypothetical protein
MTNSDQMVVSHFGAFKVLILMTNLVQKVIMLRYEMVITDIIEFSKLFLIDFLPLTTNLNGHTTITPYPHLQVGPTRPHSLPLPAPPPYPT